MNYIKIFVYSFIFLILFILLVFKYPFTIHAIGFLNPKKICIENKCFKRPKNYFFFMGYENYKSIKFPICDLQFECDKIFQLTNEKYSSNNIMLFFENFLDNKSLTISIYSKNISEMQIFNKKCIFLDKSSELNISSDIYHYQGFFNKQSIMFDIISNDATIINNTLKEICN